MEEENNYIYNPNLTNISNRQLKNLNLFWLGFIIYTLSFALSTTWLYVSYVVCQSIQIVGLILLVPPLFSLVKFKLKNSYLRILFIAYMIWMVGIVARGFQFNITFLKQMLFEVSYGVLTYVAPLILLFPTNLANYKKLFNVIILLGIFYFIYDSVFIKHIIDSDRTSLLSQGILENFAGLMGINAGFILLTYVYHSKKRQMFALAMMLITILFAIYRARRGLIFICVSMLMFYLMIYLISSKRKAMVIYLGILIGIFAALYIGSSYKQSNSGLFGFLMARADEDTRSGVEDAMKDDMSNTDWIIGKGIDGHYFCTGIDVNDLIGYRSVIETGYLQIMLKGGLVSLILLLLIAVPALVLGLFYSKNILSKAAGMWILLWVIYLYPIVPNSFNIHYLVFWISVGICYSKEIRNLPEAVLKQFFQKKDKISKELFF